MAYGQIDPARLDGDALRRWYLRSPSDIEEERRLAAERKYESFFGGPRRPGPLSAATDAAEVLDGVGQRSIESANSYGENEAPPARDSFADSNTALHRLAAVRPRSSAPPEASNCTNCHGRWPTLPPLPLPPPIGTFPFPTGGMPSFRRTPRDGSSPRHERYRQCEIQYEADSEICRTARSRACWENAAERKRYCLANEGEVGWPPLQFGGR